MSSANNPFITYTAFILRMVHLRKKALHFITLIVWPAQAFSGALKLFKFSRGGFVGRASKGAACENIFTWAWYSLVGTYVGVKVKPFLPSCVQLAMHVIFHSVSQTGFSRRTNV